MNVLNQKLWINLSTHNTKFISWKSGTMDLRLGELGLFSQLTIPTSYLGNQKYKDRTIDLRRYGEFKDYSLNLQYQLHILEIRNIGIEQLI